MPGVDHTLVQTAELPVGSGGPTYFTDPAQAVLGSGEESMVVFSQSPVFQKVMIHVKTKGFPT